MKRSLCAMVGVMGVMLFAAAPGWAEETHGKAKQPHGRVIIARDQHGHEWTTQERVDFGKAVQVRIAEHRSVAGIRFGGATPWVKANSSEPLVVAVATPKRGEAPKLFASTQTKPGTVANDFKRAPGAVHNMPLPLVPVKSPR